MRAVLCAVPAHAWTPAPPRTPSPLPVSHCTRECSAFSDLPAGSSVSLHEADSAFQKVSLHHLQWPQFLLSPFQTRSQARKRQKSWHDPEAITSKHDMQPFLPPSSDLQTHPISRGHTLEAIQCSGIYFGARISVQTQHSEPHCCPRAEFGPLFLSPVPEFWMFFPGHNLGMDSGQGWSCLALESFGIVDSLSAAAGCEPSPTCSGTVLENPGRYGWRLITQPHRISLLQLNPSVWLVGLTLAGFVKWASLKTSIFLSPFNFFCSVVTAMDQWKCPHRSPWMFFCWTEDWNTESFLCQCSPRWGIKHFWISIRLCEV